MLPATRLWSIPIKRLRARAAFADIAIAAGGIWQPKQIEKRVFAAETGEVLHEATNKFARLAKGEAAPDEGTIQAVTRTFPAANIRYWLDHPLFYLLDDHQDVDAAIRYAFDYVSGPIRMELWAHPTDYGAGTGQTLRTLDERAIMILLRGHIRAHLDHLDERDHVRYVEQRVAAAISSASTTENLKDLTQKQRGLEEALLRGEQPGQLQHLNALVLLTALAKLSYRRQETKAFIEASRMAWTFYSTAIAQHAPLLYSAGALAELFCEQLWIPLNHFQPTNVRYSTDPAWHAEKALEIALLLNLPRPPRHYMI